MCLRGCLQVCPVLGCPQVPQSHLHNRVSSQHCNPWPPQGTIQKETREKTTPSLLDLVLPTVTQVVLLHSFVFELFYIIVFMKNSQLFIPVGSTSVMVHLHCQLTRLWSYKSFPSSVMGGGGTHPEHGQFHPMSWGPSLNQKGKSPEHLIHLPLLPDSDSGHNVTSHLTLPPTFHLDGLYLNVRARRRLLL